MRGFFKRLRLKRARPELKLENAAPQTRAEPLQKTCVTCGKAENPLEIPFEKCPFCQEPSWCSEACALADEEPHVQECVKGAGKLMLVSKVTEEQKLKLFHKQLEERKAEEENAKSLLRKAAEIDETVLEFFELKSTSVARMPFRLLRIGDSYGAETLESFIAVSYCWHSDDWTPLPTLTWQKDPPLPLGLEMFQVLKQLLETDAEGVWIDQICINQKDELEKQRAIASMDLVYRSARIVVVVLEDIFITREQYQAYEDWMKAMVQSSSPSPPPRVLSGIQSLFLKLLSARWFSRAWCIHEYHSSNNCQLLVSGPTKDEFFVINLHILVSLVNRATALDTSFPPAGDLETEKKWRCLNEMEHIDTTGSEVQTAKGPPLSDLFATISSLNASFPSDKLAIVLNIASLGISLAPKPDRPSIELCWYYFSLLCMASGDFKGLTSCGELIDLTEDRLMPSWLRWPELSKFMMIMPCPTPLLGRHFIRSTFSTLKLDMYFLSETSCLDVNMMAKDTATNFVLSELGQTALGHIIPKRRESRDQGLIPALAAALHCGPRWIIRFYQDVWPSLERLYDFVPLKDELENLSPAVVKALYPSLTSQELSEDCYKSLAESLIQFIKYQFLRGQDVYRVIQFGGSDQLALTSPIAADRQVAVPACLAEPQFTEVRRLFVIERIDTTDGVFWRPVQKLPLFGCPELREDGQCVVLRKQVNVCG